MKKTEMLNDMIEAYSCSEPGFLPVVDYEGWRVAFYNTADADMPKNFVTFDIHTGTDEVFVLLSGRCMLLLGGHGEEFGEITGVDMQPDVVYNVKKGTWHAHALTQGSKVLIVENSPPVFGTTVKHRLTPDEQAALVEVCAQNGYYNW